ncbi:receptor-like protein kinase FERONIA [Phragmites australis]|uniref:receptor-like protein kinase FERONIA n=1 Tax=Phragmites australis TaxID=29695 RepID=UPI002D7759AB|nr:receptor-like protein kinase FERONIA [Phragmites australis]
MACLTLLPCLLLLSLVMLLAVAASGDNSTLSGQIRINCGSSVSATDSDGRTWDGDAASRFAPSVAGVASGASYVDPSLPSTVPYMTARVFASSYTYSFPVSPGRVFLRLFFYPSAYGDRGAAAALFGVTAGGVTLLDDFNASQTALALNYAYLVREFSLNVSSGGNLDVTFTPSGQSASGSRHYAFVNGIEIVAMPDMFTKAVPTFANGGRPDPMPIRADTAFQTMYRLNVGGRAVSPGDDSDLLYRTWDNDVPYIFGAAFGVSYGKDSNVSIQYGPAVPPYVAPESVYASARSMGPNAQINLNYNLTWALPVDAGFYYIVRLHFCEIQYPITKLNQRAFYIYINNQTALADMDVIGRSGGVGRPVYTDYLVVTVPGSSQTDLWVELHPDVNTRPEYYDAILNGLEVFKLQRYDSDSLAGPNPPILQQVQINAVEGSGAGTKKKSGAFAAAWAAAAGGLVAVLVGCICAWAICRRKRKAASAVVHVPQAVRETPAYVILGQTKIPAFSYPAR